MKAHLIIVAAILIAAVVSGCTQQAENQDAKTQTTLKSVQEEVQQPITDQELNALIPEEVPEVEIGEMI